MRPRAVLAGVALALGVAGTAWWLTVDAQPVSVDSVGDRVQTVSRGKLPVFAAPADTGRLYAFATSNPETLRWVPCTCGCGDLGHTSNRSCYVKEETSSRVTFTSHAAT